MSHLKGGGGGGGPWRAGMSRRRGLALSILLHGLRHRPGGAARWCSWRCWRSRLAQPVAAVGAPRSSPPCPSSCGSCGWNRTPQALAEETDVAGLEGPALDPRRGAAPSPVSGCWCPPCWVRPPGARRCASSRCIPQRVKAPGRCRNGWPCALLQVALIGREFSRSGVAIDRSARGACSCLNHAAVPRGLTWILAAAGGLVGAAIGLDGRGAGAGDAAHRARRLLGRSISRTRHWARLKSASTAIMVSARPCRHQRRADRRGIGLSCPDVRYRGLISPWRQSAPSAS